MRSLLLVLVPCLALASERKISREEVPKAVLDGALARYPKAKLVRFVEEVSAGRKTYEITLEAEGKRTDLVLSAEGKPLVAEQVIGLKDLPGPVQKGLSASKYAKARVDRVERVEDLKTASAPTFELIVDVAGRKRELSFDGTGALTKDEEADDED
jgi:hypothetical protein